MPCQIAYRDDSQQVLLFKIASCLADGSFISGVSSFNTRTGAVTLTAADVSTALGCTPLCQSDGDARYVLKSGDSMTGALSIDNGVLVANDPALELSQTWNNAAVTFTGLFSNITNTASAADSNLFNFQTDGIDRFRYAAIGQLFATRQDATNSGVTFFQRKRGNAGGATNAVAADATIGTITHSGWNGAAYVNGSRISGLANEAWTGIANGSRIDLYTTPDGSTSEQITLRLAATGQALFTNGTAALPSLSFQSDLNTGIYRIGADSFGSSAGGSLILATSTTGINLTDALAYQYNGVNVIRAQTALDNYFFGPSGNLTMTGANNVSAGASALLANTTGARNIAVGSNAMTTNLSGTENVSVGHNSLLVNQSGNTNVAIGFQALVSNVSGSDNTSLGSSSLANTTGGTNTGIGSAVLFNLSSGSGNTAVGYLTGLGITTGSNNTILGANVAGLAAALSNNIILADGAGVIRLQIDSSGNTTLAGTVATADGTAALPAYTFSADLNTGIYRVGADILGFSTAGVQRAIIDAAGQVGIGTGTSSILTKVDILGANVVNNGILTVRTNNAQAINIGGSIALGGFTDDAASITNVFAVVAGRKSTSTTTGRSGYFSIECNNAGTLTEYFRISDTGLISLPTVARLSMASGANQRAGNATLVAGTVTVANTSVTANTIVILTRKTSGGTLGTAITYTVIAATSFTINSDSALDTSTFSYLLIENP